MPSQPSLSLGFLFVLGICWLRGFAIEELIRGLVSFLLPILSFQLPVHAGIFDATCEPSLVRVLLSFVTSSKILSWLRVTVMVFLFLFYLRTNRITQIIVLAVISVIALFDPTLCSG